MRISTAHSEIIWSNADNIKRINGIGKELTNLIDIWNRNGIPIAPTIKPFKFENTAIRPFGHFRTFYIPLANICELTASSYIGIKGTEPLAKEDHIKMRDGGFNTPWINSNQYIEAKPIIDYFPLNENKVPFLLTKDEALSEAILGARISNEYINRYGELPLTPLPLIVAKLPDSCANDFFEIICPQLSKSSNLVISHYKSEGAYVLIYYYPCEPFPRVRHYIWECTSKNSINSQVLDITSKNSIIKKWIKLFTRLLALGYLPASPFHNSSGQSCQAQNVVVNGGFMDMGSVVEIETCRSLREVVESYTLSISCLANTIQNFLFMNTSDVKTYTSELSLATLYLYENLRLEIDNDIKFYGDQFLPLIKDLPPFSGSITSRSRNIPLSPMITGAGGEIGN